MYKRLALSALIAVGSMFVTSVAAADDTDTNVVETDSGDDSVVVDYRGQLQNADGEPISGVFHLEFKLYSTENSKEPNWSERQYIAVNDGTYKVPLGRRAGLTRETLDTTPWIGVELVGEGEILRDRLNLGDGPMADNGSNPEALPEGSNTKETEKLLEKAQQNDQMAFADVAERAVAADRAKRADTADKIGSMNAKEIEELSNLALERLGEHIADPKAHEASGGGLGDGRRVMDSIGGPGGASYQSKCPPGYVVTGIRGGSGRVVDSISLICQPLK